MSSLLSLCEEKKSFRKYLSLLYSNPKMKVYIENSKVRTRILEQTLYSTTSYIYITKAFTSSSEQDVKEAAEDLDKGLYL